MAQIDWLEDFVSARTRARPARPLIRKSYTRDPAHRDSLLVAWGTGRKLGWVSRSMVRVHTTTLERMIEWSYRAGFDGLLLANLYPLERAALGQWLQTDRDDDINAGARYAADLAHEFAIRQVVLATGDLNPVEAKVLAQWLMVFRARRVVSWRCLSITDHGWPASIAVSGRTALAHLDSLTLQPWALPVVKKRRPGLVKRVVEKPVRRRRRTPLPDGVLDSDAIGVIGGGTLAAGVAL